MYDIQLNVYFASLSCLFVEKLYSIQFAIKHNYIAININSRNIRRVEREIKTRAGNCSEH